jgi:hypothetical protein
LLYLEIGNWIERDELEQKLKFGSLGYMSTIRFGGLGLRLVSWSLVICP